MTFLVDGTLGGTFPSWTTATRPASPAVGQMGYNTTTGLFDQYIAAGWTPVGAATGNVLQVVNGTYATQSSSSSSTYTDSGLTLSITPKFATSKILVTVVTNDVLKFTSDTYLGLRVVRGSTTIITFAGGASYTQSTATNTTSAACTYLDSPATTASTTYKVQFNSANNTASVQFNSGGATSSMMTLMEIAA